MSHQVAYVTTAAVAKRFAVDPATVRRWAADGRLPAVVTPGGHYRFRMEDVEALLNPSSQRNVAPTISAAAAAS